MKVKWRVVFNKFPNITAAMDYKANALVTKAAMDIEAQAKTRVPVDTGTLKNSIQATKVGHAHWRVVVGADYGMYVEWGTARMGAQPYFQPAIAAVSPAFRRALKDLVTP